MAHAQEVADVSQIDRLSDLPDELLLMILSFLRTDLAARTSILCRRFRHLWEASPSLQFVFVYLLYPKLTIQPHNYIAMTDRALLCRDPSHPLLTLRLEFSGSQCISSLPVADPNSYVISLINKAGSLGLRHLTIEGASQLVRHILPTIFSIDSLESLSLPAIWLQNFYPAGFTPTCLRLRSLSLRLHLANSDRLSKLISELCSLEDLHLKIDDCYRLRLSSESMRKFRLIIGSGESKLSTIELFLPSLESIHFETQDPFSSLFQIHVEVPLLNRAVIIFDEACVQNNSIRLLNSISHVEELSLHIKVERDDIPSPILLEPGQRMPQYPNLKHLDVHFSFHEHNFEAVMMMLHNCPALESLKLSPEITRFTGWEKERKIREWGSRLPFNAGGNYCYAYLTNLHIGENRKEFIELLGKKYMPL